jgi:hypothetical protein
MSAGYVLRGSDPSVFKTVSAVNVCDRLRPVHIVSRHSVVGHGTLILNQAGLPSRIVTAGHVLIQGSLDASYGYSVLTTRGYGDVGRASGFRRFSLREASQSHVVADLAFTELDEFPVNAKTLVSPEWVNGTESMPYGSIKFRESFAVRSVVTGKSCQVIGIMKRPREPVYYVLLYRSSPGESGTGFFDEDTGMIYVLNQAIPVEPGTRSHFGLGDSWTQITLATPIRAGL